MLVISFDPIYALLGGPALTINSWLGDRNQFIQPGGLGGCQSTKRTNPFSEEFSLFLEKPFDNCKISSLIGFSPPIKFPCRNWFWTHFCLLGLRVPNAYSGTESSQIHIFSLYFCTSLVLAGSPSFSRGFVALTDACSTHPQPRTTLINRKQTNKRKGKKHMNQIITNKWEIRWQRPP